MKKHLQRLLALLLASVLLCAMAAGTFAVSVQEDFAKGMYTEINRLRRAQGLHTLKWDKALEEAATIRCWEITDNYPGNHVRPDGREFFTVSTAVWGENIAYGYQTVDEVMTAFMDSQGHRDNILYSKYTTVATACLRGDDGLYYWVQLFGNGTSNRSWTGTGDYDLDPYAAAQANLPLTPAPASAGGRALNTATLVNSLKRAIAATTSKSISFQVRNGSSISPETLQMLAKTAQTYGRTARLKADTLNASGNAVQGRILLEPAKLTGRKTPILLGVYVDSSSTKHLYERVGKYYSGRMAYIHMEHQGTLTVRTKISAKVNLTGMDTTQLRLYLYDSSKNKLVRITDPNYSIDKNGYLSFYTATAGDIVITEHKLAVK